MAGEKGAFRNPRRAEIETRQPTSCANEGRARLASAAREQAISRNASSVGRFTRRSDHRRDLRIR
jgi:hypothetical protein